MPASKARWASAAAGPQLLRVQASDAANFFHFGVALALSYTGARLVVAALQADVHGAGAAYVFDRPPGTNLFYESQKIVTPDPLISDGFAGCLAISGDGNTIALGTHSTSGAASVGVCIYTKVLGLWTLQQQIATRIGSGIADEPMTVALSDDGNTLVIGDPALSVFGGEVNIWTRAAGVWSKTLGPLIGAVEADQLGKAVAISADGTAVAAASNLHVTTWGAPAWGHVGDFAFTTTRPLGVALDQAGTRLLVAEHDTFFTGAASFFDTASGATLARVTPPDVVNGQGFGFCCALSRAGDRAVVGSDYPIASAPFGGYLFAPPLQLVQELVGADSVAGDQLGQAVALSGDGLTVALGAWRDSHAGGIEAGSVYLFM